MSSRQSEIHGPCSCREKCGDVWQDEADPAMPVCKALTLPSLELAPAVKVSLQGGDRQRLLEALAPHIDRVAAAKKMGWDERREPDNV